MAIKPILQNRRAVACAIAFCLLTASPAASARKGDGEESVHVFIDRYFSAWSSGNMDAYRDCFHPKATIVFLDRANAPKAEFALEAFIQSQAEAHRKSVVKMREIPLSKRVMVAGKAGQAIVRWKLFKDRQHVTGVDLFTLVLTSGKWKILHLAVQND